MPRQCHMWMFSSMDFLGTVCPDPYFFVWSHLSTESPRVLVDQQQQHFLVDVLHAINLRQSLQYRGQRRQIIIPVVAQKLHHLLGNMSLLSCRIDGRNHLPRQNQLLVLVVDDHRCVGGIQFLPDGDTRIARIGSHNGSMQMTRFEIGKALFRDKTQRSPQRAERNPIRSKSRIMTKDLFDGFVNDFTMGFWNALPTTLSFIVPVLDAVQDLGIREITHLKKPKAPGETPNN